MCCLALCRVALDFFVQNLYKNEYVWSSAMPHNAGQSCIVLDKLVKLKKVIFLT
jgi:hypothetical protein